MSKSILCVFRRFLIVVLGAVLVAGCSRTALEEVRRVTAEPFEGGVIVLDRFRDTCEMTISGTLTQDATRKLRLVLEALDGQSCSRRVARLQIDDGSFNVAITVGAMLRNRRFDTVIDAAQACQTTCLLVFASGVERTVPVTARQVGFSAMLSETASGTAVCVDRPTRRQLFAVGRYFQAMLDAAAVESVLAQLMSARCGELRGLSSETLRTIGLATVVRGV